MHISMSDSSSLPQCLTQSLIYGNRAFIRTGKKTTNQHFISFHFVPDTELSSTGEDRGVMPALQKATI